MRKMKLTEKGGIVMRKLSQARRPGSASERFSANHGYATLVRT